jgi:hypothetical protein
MTRREIAAILAAAPTLAIAAGKGGWRELFNGRNLDGWDGDPRFWKVDNGIIVGSTDQQSTGQNTFLVYKEPFSNFHLISEVKLRNGNSGIQFRSERKEGWIVAGYQADFSDDGDRSAWGNFYEERGRGRGVMATPDEGWRKGKALVRPGDWNEIQVLACGPRIEVKLNAQTTVQARDDRAASGVIAIQLHSGKPMQVAVRKMRIRPMEGSC